jgi:hypothetical protein
MDARTWERLIRLLDVARQRGDRAAAIILASRLIASGGPR